MTRFFWLGISVHSNAKFGFVVHLRTNLWFSGTMVCTNGCFAHPHLDFYAPASSCGCVSHCLTRGIKECGASAVTCSLVRVCCFSQLAATFSLILLQPCPCMQVSSVLPFCPIAPPSVHQNLLPRFCPSVLLNLGQVVSCNSIWWWCLIAFFEVVGRNRYSHWQFCVISDPCV